VYGIVTKEKKELNFSREQQIIKISIIKKRIEAMAFKQFFEEFFNLKRPGCIK
jgi:DNA-binding transcriptional regulator LsrR (DeoR family)